MSWKATTKGGRAFPTKKALKEAVDTDPTSVLIVGYGVTNYNMSYTFANWVEKLHGNGVNLVAVVITGPNPEVTPNMWYASPVRKRNGTVTVK